MTTALTLRRNPIRENPAGVAVARIAAGFRIGVLVLRRSGEPQRPPQVAEVGTG